MAHSLDQSQKNFFQTNSVASKKSIKTRKVKIFLKSQGSKNFRNFSVLCLSCFADFLVKHSEEDPLTKHENCSNTNAY
ncbi:hypothetical protein FDUTEX481_08687 [Tolypothrix sp. PCC 7601]|nr:hypothetical protein FDUTEX481_08687 [Tolypothrix sp. PCC 7601]